MSSLTSTDAMALMSSEFIQNCVTAAIVALLAYDLVLTLGSEVELFWCQRGTSVNKAAFFLLRICVLGTVITTVLNAYVPMFSVTLGGCAAANNANNAFWFIGALVITAVTAMRVYVVSGGKWVWITVTMILNSFYLGWIGYITYATVYQLVVSGDSWVCGISVAMPATSNTIGTFMALMGTVLADIVLIIATWVCTFHCVRIQRRTRLWSRSVAWLLFRDGNVYFLAMFSLNTVVCVIGMWSDNLSWLGDLNFPLQLVLVTRLLINLRELSRSGDDIIIGSQSTSAGSHGPSDPAIEVSTVRFHDGSTLRDEEETRDNQTETGGNDATDDTPQMVASYSIAVAT